MATMAIGMPYQMHEFEVVEEKVTRVSAGLTFSQTMNLVIQACFSAIHLTAAFHSAVTEQRTLIGMLLHSSVQNFPSEQLNALAEKIEHLVAANETVISNSNSVTFRPWTSYLDQLKDQSEHLASIAESFRMANDDESLSILAGAAKEMNSGYPVTSETLLGPVHA